MASFLHSRLAAYLGYALLTACISALLLATIYWTLFDPRWIVFLSGVLFAAIPALGVRASQAEWRLLRRTRKLEKVQRQLEEERTRSHHTLGAFQTSEERLRTLSDAVPDAFGSIKGTFSGLKNLPFDFVKIDGIIIQNMLRNPSELARARAISTVCRNIGALTVAELVESSETLKLLHDIGIDYAQGFGVAHPAPLLLPSALDLPYDAPASLPRPLAVAG